MIERASFADSFNNQRVRLREDFFLNNFNISILWSQPFAKDVLKVKNLKILRFFIGCFIKKDPTLRTYFVKKLFRGKSRFI
jgi:hypothetical protein